MKKSVFFIGIKGVGMTALALAMQDVGWEVAGSDNEEIFITDAILAKRHIAVSTPIDAPIPENVEKIIYSGAYVANEGAKHASTEQLSLAEALAEFVQDRQVIAVAGVGGKTTTTAMLAVMFRTLGRDVGYYVGTGSIAGLAAPGAAGIDPYYIVEADEYAISKSDHRPKFALLTPQILITTNIVHDHPDIYPDIHATRTTFIQLITKLHSGTTWIASSDDALTKEILDLRGQALQDQGITVVQYSKSHPLMKKLKLSVFGDQNSRDALAAVLAAIAAGVSEQDALGAITAYKGAGRRQEFHGEREGRLLYDDYGHHPHEIAQTVKAFKEHFAGRRLLLVFEAHTYSRTESLLQEFAQALTLADLTFIMPIFESAREKGQSHTTTPDSFAALIPNAVALTWENAAHVVWDASGEGDIILTMGAGFVYKLHDIFKQS